MPVAEFSPNELKGAKVFLLLEIDFGTHGKFRISTEPINVPGTDGGQFDGGLDSLTFADAVDLFSTTESNRSVSVSVLLPVDVSKLIAKGFDPSRAVASLSQWIQGTEYNDRQKLLVDVRLRNPQYGESYEPFRFTIRSNMFDDQTVIPPIDAVINEITFPNSTEWQQGKPYPWIFGTPGKVKSLTSSSFAYNFAVPAYPVTIDSSTFAFVIAGHEMTPGTVVNIVEKAAPSAVHTVTVTNYRDDLGRLISIAPYDGSAGAPFGPMTASGVGWDPGYESIDFVASISAGGGVLNEQRTNPRRGAGEIIEYLLDYAPTLPFDRGKTRTASNTINEYTLDGVISEPVEVWRFLRANVLPYVPVSISQSADGMFPIPWHKDMTENDTVAVVDAEKEQWERTSPITVEFLDGKPQNKFSIAFHKGALSDSMLMRSSLDGKLKTSNSYARTSYKRYGTQNRPEEDAICFYRQSDVDAVLSWWSRIYGFPVKSVEYVAALQWGWLNAGDYIVFSDFRISVTDQIAIVQSIEFSDDQIVGFRLVWLEDLPRDSRFL